MRANVLLHQASLWAGKEQTLLWVIRPPCLHQCSEWVGNPTNVRSFVLLGQMASEHHWLEQRRPSWDHSMFLAGTPPSILPYPVLTLAQRQQVNLGRYDFSKGCCALDYIPPLLLVHLCSTRCCQEWASAGGTMYALLQDTVLPDLASLLLSFRAGRQELCPVSSSMEWSGQLGSVLSVLRHPAACHMQYLTSLISCKRQEKDTWNQTQPTQTKALSWHIRTGCHPGSQDDWRKKEGRRSPFPPLHLFILSVSWKRAVFICGVGIYGSQWLLHCLSSSGLKPLKSMASWSTSCPCTHVGKPHSDVDSGHRESQGNIPESENPQETVFQRQSEDSYPWNWNSGYHALSVESWIQASFSHLWKPENRWL